MAQHVQCEWKGLKEKTRGNIVSCSSCGCSIPANCPFSQYWKNVRLKFEDVHGHGEGGRERERHFATMSWWSPSAKVT